VISCATLAFLDSFEVKVAKEVIKETRWAKLVLYYLVPGYWQAHVRSHFGGILKMLQNKADR
jgi:hypothetical protein